MRVRLFLLFFMVAVLPACQITQNYNVAKDADPARVVRLIVHPELRLSSINGVEYAGYNSWRSVELTSGDYELHVYHHKHIRGELISAHRKKTVSLMEGQTYYLCPIVEYNQVNDMIGLDFDLIIDNRYSPPLLPATELAYVPPECRREDNVYR